MRELLKYLKAYRKESILAPLFKMLEATFELFIPLVVQQIIDVGIGNGDTGYILQMGGLLVLLGVVGLAASLTAQYFAAKAAVGFSTSLRNDLFAHINRLSYAEIDRVGTSTLITRMTSDINQVQTGLNLFLRLFLRSPFIVFGAMIMAFTVDVRSAITFVVVIPLLSVVVFGIMLITMPLYKKVQRQLDQVLLATKENLEGVRVIRAFNRQEDEMKRFERENSQLVDMQVFVGKISALMNPVTYVIINGGIIVLVWTAGKQVDAGVITQGAVVALVNYMSQILVELIKLANLIINISKALACAGRVQKVFEEKSSIADPAESSDGKVAVSAGDFSGGSASAARKGTDFIETSAGSPAGAVPKVEFRNVDFCYGESKEPSLSGISLKVQPGQTIGVIGGTGSGKSTLVNLIPRFYDVFRGEVLIDGKDVRQWPLNELRRRIGVVPQRAVLFAGTLRENMKWGRRDASDEEIYRALSIAQAKDFVDDKGEGLDLAIAQEGKNLSGGQKQRLTIARALVRQPEILIMDDSASALDFATDARLRKAIKEETKGMTVFLVSQRAATVRGADVIVVLDDGAVAGIGTHSELIRSCQVYREICLSQLSPEEVQ
ncbi:MAG TPA: ABC transporter ATP-binding protein/permease [Candidatus Lachnoclostridium pullistercoris]|uniref:ABC transporter ATP-binding protein/permease n=1 Tax=Candidatus Lachnoclostridium pullistercoris TaxID=2838632 RepID=A0A9D2T6L9_9FIRM|nr:ABC transporter ATP-binding protein/permease [Candidatus Lachnoclostridium pullistercoris]